MKCRFDQQELTEVCIDLGFSPPSNSFLKREQLDDVEKNYPLKLYVSQHTYLVQLAEYKNASEIFSDDYVYFSSYSTYWLEHARQYANMAITRFNLNTDSQVMEIASNDGYLLQYFLQKGIQPVGVEPSGSVAKVAMEKGIHTIQEFFGNTFAQEYIKNNPRPDLIIGNNVFAHVPDINDFTSGLATMLSPGGTITLEFPHVYNLVLQNQFDTIYHEHFWYFSLFSVMKVLEKYGLRVYDVEELPTHGGSLRLLIAHRENENLPVLPTVNNLLKKELDAGINTFEFYFQLQKNAELVKDELLVFLLQEKLKGKKIAAYGAAAKGNTLLNYCGIKPDLVNFVVDASPHKQGRWLPGSHIPVVSEDRLAIEQPDYVLILPWNLKDEIQQQLAYIKNWGGKFIIPVPKLEVR